MKIGYARVSTADQHTDSQEEALREAGCEKVFIDRAESGGKRHRSELRKLIEQLRPEDVVVVTKLDRLSRSLHDMLGIVKEIGDVGADLRSLAESTIDTTSAAGRLVFQIFAVVAEFERSRLRERTKEGLAHARAHGVQLGAPRKLNPTQVDALRKLRREGVSYGELGRTFGISRSSAFRYANGASP